MFFSADGVVVHPHSGISGYYLSMYPSFPLNTSLPGRLKIMVNLIKYIVYISSGSIDLIGKSVRVLHNVALLVFSIDIHPSIECHLWV